MPRRGENIHKRADGRWEGRLQTGINGATGKPHFKSVYATTYKEAKTKLAKLKRDLENGLVIEGNSLTIRAWVEKWLNDYKRGQVEPTTFENYRYSVNHIYKHLGQYKLKDLRPDHIQAFINTLGADGHNRVLKIVAEWLGHSTIRVTGDIYSHALPEKKRDSMEKLKGKLIGLG